MKLIQFILIFLLLTSFSLAQLVTVPQSTGEKFNERGYLKSASKKLENNEIVSDYDGNLNVIYMSEVNAPNNLGGQITITYNPNVEHRMMINLQGANRYGYPINAPEWIIGYKGYALQTLNFESNFYSHKNSPGMPTHDLKGEETPLLIPGYHYTNKMGNSVDGTPEGSQT
jgi:hypothetical protein